MGKRSNFERREADFYPTPQAAVVPLIPYLRGIRTFAEPCVGDGDLVRHLESFGLRCVYQGDIRTGQDALAVNSYGKADAIITNPPFSRENRPEPVRRTRVCAQCGRPYELQRVTSRVCSQGCKQRTYRERLSVTPSVTAPSVEGEFRYVPHADIPKFRAEGWELLPALDGTHHGEYSALMRRRG
jgi:hypothetical protein